MSQKLLIKLLVFSLLLVCPSVAFSKKVKVPPYQNELLVIGALKKLYAVQAAYYKMAGNGKFGNASQLRNENLIDDFLAAGEKYGYYFSIQAGSSAFDPRFYISAKPKAYRKTGKRSFYMDANCKVRGDDKTGAEANASDAVIETCAPTLAFENERRAILVMRTLASAEETYRATIGNGNYGLFSELQSAGLIEFIPVFTNFSYKFAMVKTDRTASTAPFFKIYSEPYIYGQMGFRSFYADETGIIRGADHQGNAGNANDPPITDK